MLFKNHKKEIHLQYLPQKTLYISGPVQFKPVLFKHQLYFMSKESEAQ